MLTSSIACLRLSSRTGVNEQKSAASSVPAKLAARTRPHIRAISQRFRREKSASKGRTTVIVVSVNNCWRARITMRNPME